VFDAGHVAKQPMQLLKSFATKDHSESLLGSWLFVTCSSVSCCVCRLYWGSSAHAVVSRLAWPVSVWTCHVLVLIFFSLRLSW
jgi:hypothetical protein